MNTVKTYTTRSNALRAAKSAGFTKEQVEILEAKNGQFFFSEMSKPHGFELHNLYHCPHCNITLANGVLQNGDEGGDGKTLEFETNEFMCMACGKEFGPAFTPKTEKAPAKVPTKSIAVTHESVIENPCKQVWNIATDMKEANPAIKRGAVLAACVEAGIAYYTARTQYQQWLTVQKEMAEREAGQAK